jgi:transposase
VEQQGILALHGARSLLVKHQTMVANAMRGLATEFGITVPKGIRKLDELMTLVDADESIPKQAKQAITGLHDYGKDPSEGIESFEAGIVPHARHDETAGRLATITAIDPITASLIAASVVDIGLFKTARQFAAWLGLVPPQNSSGGKTPLGRVTRTGRFAWALGIHKYGATSKVQPGGPAACRPKLISCCARAPDVPSAARSTASTAAMTILFNVKRVPLR